MAGKSFVAADVDTALFNQATSLASFIHQLEDWLYGWQNNCPDVTALNTLGYTDTANQAQALQHIQNVAVLLQAIQGTQTVANTHNMFNDVAKLRKLG